MTGIFSTEKDVLTLLQAPCIRRILLCVALSSLPSGCTLLSDSNLVEYMRKAFAFRPFCCEMSALREVIDQAVPISATRWAMSSVEAAGVRGDIFLRSQFLHLYAVVCLLRTISHLTSAKRKTLCPRNTVSALTIVASKTWLTLTNPFSF